MAAVRNVTLGELELAIMDFIWKRNKPITVPDVHDHLLKERKLAYTSTMTVMSRLFEKGLLDRTEEKRPYTYWAAVGRDDYSADMMVQVLAQLGDRKAALARFVERIGSRDARVLAALVEESKARR